MSVPIKGYLGKAVAYLRKRRRVKQSQMFRMTGLAQSTISDIERQDTVNPTIDALEKISLALDIPLSRIFIEAEDIRSEERLNERS